MESRFSSIPAAARRAVQRPTLLHAVQRYWQLPVLMIVIFGALAAAVALAREPTYKAESLLVVGKVDVETPGLSGFVSTTQSLASAYSRAVGTSAVIDPASKEVGLPPSEISGRVSASPVPESPVFRVEAEASSEKEAIELSNATSKSLVRYIGNINSGATRQSDVVEDLENTLVELSRAEDRRDRLRNQARRTPSNATREALAQAEAEVQTTRLRARSLSKAYEASQTEPSTNLVQILSPARSASNDRTQTLQIYTFLGILVGLVLGIALARLRANRAAMGAARLALDDNRR